jgi:hypothetical protein
MELTPALTSWIEKRIDKILRKQLGLTRNDFPIMLYSTENIPLPLTETFGSPACDDVFGACSPHIPAILLNIEKIQDQEELEKTIIHELVHYRFGIREHDEIRFMKKFYDIKNGEMFNRARIRYMLDPRWNMILYRFVTDTAVMKFPDGCDEEECLTPAEKQTKANKTIYGIKRTLREEHARIGDLNYA